MAKGWKVMVKVKVMNHETNLESHWLDVMAGHDMTCYTYNAQCNIAAVTLTISLFFLRVYGNNS
jgi:hypothetical protein